MSTRQVLAVFSLLAVCAFSGCDDETVVVGVDCIANACDASDASVIKKCVNGQFQEGKCADVEVCVEDVKKGAMCQPKQSDPADKCEPEQTKCDGDKIATCGADEKWGVAVKCEGENEVCQTIDGIDKCAPKQSDPADKCEPEQKKCDGDKIATCGADKAWGESIDCERPGEVCILNAEGKALCQPKQPDPDGKCVPDKTKCEGEKIATCGADEKWGVAVVCEGENEVCQTIDGIDKCAVCKPGTSKCDGTLNGFQECSNGGAAWGRVIDCGDENAPVCAEVSSGVAKCVACENDKMRCNHMTKTPKVEKCVDHEWKQHESCGGKVCLDGTETQPPKCVDCEGDQKKCNGTVIQTCDNNTWKDGKDCSTEGKVCDHSTFECVDKCNDGDAKCDDSGAFFICKSNTWVKKTDCGAKDKCVDKVSTPDKMNLGCKCARNAELCDANNDNVLICKEMKEGSVVYMSLDVFKECAKGMCANAIESVPGKPSMAYCKCNDGDFECKDSKNYRYCKDGKWESKACAKPETCDAELRTCNTQCTSSMASASTCSGWNRLTCKDSKDGKLVFAEACTNGCQYRTNNAVTPVVPKNLTPRIASGDRGRCIENAVAGMKRCSIDSKDVEVYVLQVGASVPTGKWKREWCDKGQVCMWKKSPDLTHSTSETPQCVQKVCTEGVFKCSDDKSEINQCINNTWEVVGKCAAGLKCQSETISYKRLTCS